MLRATLGIPAGSGTYDVAIQGGSDGPTFVALALHAGIGSATVTIQYRLIGASSYLTATGVNAASSYSSYIYGPVADVRLTVAGGGLPSGGGTLWALGLNPQGFPLGAFEGTRALTTQSYVEANVKNGVQYQASNYTAALAAGANLDYIVRVGSKPVLIKSRTQQFDGAGIRLEAYKAPISTGGSPLAYYNFNTWQPVTGLAQIIVGATISSVGTKCAADRTMLGSTDPGISIQASGILSDADGLETVLQPSTDYLFRTVSIDPANPQRVSGFVTWYEGGLDLPLS